MGEAALSVPQALISRLARASRILTMSATIGMRHVSKEASLAHRARSVTLSTYWASSMHHEQPVDVVQANLRRR